jgi:hypothetical protein
MPASPMQRQLESALRERRFPGSPYKVHSEKDQRLGFKRPEQHNSSNRFVSAVASRRSVSPSEQEWHAMDEEINAASFILCIENEFESDDFVPYSRSTLSRATEFLRRLMIHAHAANVIGVGVPQVGPADRGSIDLYWETSDRTLLINFPAFESVANYYGKKAKSEISGRFDPIEARPELALWLTD